MLCHISSVRLNVAADYMLQICAEVDGRDVGSVCNYLIVCVGDIKDNVLEEIKKLKPREFKGLATPRVFLSLVI